MKKYWPQLFGACALVVAGSSAHATEVMSWKKIPLRVPLVVGEERVIFVDEEVRVGMPSSLAGKLRVQSTDGVVYLQASEAIDKARLQLQLAESGEHILLDLSAVPGTEPLEPVRIIRYSATPEVDAKVDATQTPIPASLVRYAAQSLYAPLRTIEPLPGVQRAPLRLDESIRLLVDEQITAKPMAVWRLQDYWITAVKLINRSPRRVELDPRQLQASLFSAVFQHTYLGPAGQPEDTSVAYLVTRSAGLESALLLPQSKEAPDAR